MTVLRRHAGLDPCLRHAGAGSGIQWMNILYIIMSFLLTGFLPLLTTCRDMLTPE